jgi:long-chain acyl-CoA synthetase
LVFDAARAKALGHAASTLRAVVVSGGTGLSPWRPFHFFHFYFAGHIADHSLTPTRIALSIPLVNAFIHPLVAAPVFASHPLDLQDIPSPSGVKVAHTGPPSANVEVKLAGVDDETVEAGSDPEGKLMVRGPPVGKRVGLEDYVDVAETEDGWTPMEVRARVLTNGTFLVS